jgi:hypothetical protein
LFSQQQRKLKMLALLCGVLFAVGLTQLFLLRFEAGNIYPPYSSLRSDPLGTRALFDSLNRLAADTVGRNFRPLRQVKLDPKTTFVMVGLHDTNAIVEKKKVEGLLEHLAEAGGRLVLTFSAATGHRYRKHIDESESNDNLKNGTDGDADPIEEFVVEDNKDEDCTSGEDQDAVCGLNTLGAKIRSTRDDPTDEFAVRFADGPAILPLEIPWRSPLYFELRENNWEILYRWQDAPVVVQRPWGKGSVVMAADSYLLSNEALRNHRSSGLLAWLMVPGHDILFDEFHKGLVKQPGVAGLARQYRLHWVFGAIFVVAGLFIWRQAAIFVPSVQSERGPSDAPPAVGRDTSQGLVHLYRQHISPKKVMTVCFQAWKSQAAQRVSSSRIDEVRVLVEQATADSRKEVHVETYKQICELLKQGKRS